MERDKLRERGFLPEIPVLVTASVIKGIREPCKPDSYRDAQSKHTVSKVRGFCSDVCSSTSVL